MGRKKKPKIPMGVTGDLVRCRVRIALIHEGGQMYGLGAEIILPKTRADVRVKDRTVEIIGAYEPPPPPADETPAASISESKA
jgi:hypothetical protein